MKKLRDLIINRITGITYFKYHSTIVDGLISQFKESDLPQIYKILKAETFSSLTEVVQLVAAIMPQYTERVFLIQTSPVALIIPSIGALTLDDDYSMAIHKTEWKAMTEKVIDLSYLGSLTEMLVNYNHSNESVRVLFATYIAIINSHIKSYGRVPIDLSDIFNKLTLTHWASTIINKANSNLTLTGIVTNWNFIEEVSPFEYTQFNTEVLFNNGQKSLPLVGLAGTCNEGVLFKTVADGDDAYGNVYLCKCNLAPNKIPDEFKKLITKLLVYYTSGNTCELSKLSFNPRVEAPTWSGK